MRTAASCLLTLRGLVAPRSQTEQKRAYASVLRQLARDTQAFTVTCYEVPPLYCIVLKSQILFDRRFATIVTRVSY